MLTIANHSHIVTSSSSDTTMAANTPISTADRMGSPSVNAQIAAATPEP